MARGENWNDSGSFCWIAPVRRRRGEEDPIPRSGRGLTRVLRDRPTSGANGGFRLERAGQSYILSYNDGGWVVFSIENLPHVGPGYIVFGQFAEEPSLPAFPWVPQT